MKDASSNPLAFNPNYEEQRKNYLPVQQRNATGKSRKPPVPLANTKQSPESRTASDFDAAPPSEPRQRQ
ncbi:hypothetical protein [Paracnuella aquatica]|uniref:hypothetical protein n=1 Tax=Paracnuella aquatica TaxID=2268757 RepID=UPI000F4E7EE5|nr:hypothetical protein [Paracnuella aquatica]RPD48917.1 hypothetical protein DRJ53_09665 [Paracnuella aquatica]